MSSMKDKVEEGINNTGYPLELYTGSTLSKYGELVFYNEYFFDYDAKKARSVDLYVPRFPNKNSKKFGNLSSQIAIECKKSSDTAWVFFEVDSPVLPDFLGQFVDSTQILKKQYHERHLLWDIDENLKFHYSSTDVTKIAQNFQVVKVGDTNPSDGDKKTSKRKDTIFEAVNQVIKFISFTIKENEKLSLEQWKGLGKVLPVFDLYFPIIIYDGPMFTGILNDEKIKLTEVDHVILEHTYKPNYSDGRLTFLIDIIKKEKLLELLPKLENDVNLILEHIAKNESKINESIHGMYVGDARLSQSHSS